MEFMTNNTSNLPGKDQTEVRYSTTYQPPLVHLDVKDSKINSL